MANQLKMAMVKAIITLKDRGWSMRRIARELGIHRETVTRYIERERLNPKPTTQAPLGSEVGSKPATEAPLGSETGADPPDTQALGTRSKCEPYRAIIENKLQINLTAQRIYQDLVAEHGYTDSYYSVRRFVKKLGGNEITLPFRRMECAPGDEAQIDFGTAAPVTGSDGKRRHSYVLRIVLSHSRKAYSEVVFRQTTDNFIACLENAFRHFGGVPKTLIIDNLKAAVSTADWYDPDLNPKIQSFCQHYGTVILPAKPYMARHKGKIERGIGYVKGNALKGKRFNSIAEQNAYLLQWETNIADKRIHGTIRKQVERVFEEVERQALLPLPAGRFPSFEEAKRSVHRDGHIEVKKAYYSVPPEYVGREVWARWDGHLVRIYNSRMDQLVVHIQVDPGKFQTAPEHIHSKKISSVERGAQWLLKRAEFIGPSAEAWAKEMLAVRGIQGIRVLVGLMNLAHKYSTDAVDNACRTALTHGAFRVRTLRELIKHGGLEQQEFTFIDEHPIIRDMSDYGAIVKAAMH
jgi:transposase